VTTKGPPHKARPKQKPSSAPGKRSHAPVAQRTPNAPDSRFPIVGLGASAGGLGALDEFFEHLPADSGMAFVVVTHQHAGQPSLLSELLGRRTAMPVAQVSEATQVEPNHVYTIRPGYDVTIVDGLLQPAPVQGRVGAHLPIDHFFRSLAQDQKELAIGIVLSGTGSDGSLGLKEIKAELGMVMVQDEQSAQYTGMPHSAIATALVDYVLPAKAMPAQLLAYAPLVAGRPEGAHWTGPAPPQLQQIFQLLRGHTGHDFSQYKTSTVGRRIERRVNVHHFDSVKRYLRYLETNPPELDLLFRELLIGVTSFFRDPEVWQALGDPLRGLLEDKPDGYVFRAWVPGCSTGEEAYTLAILVRECLDRMKRTLGVQIFATDLDDLAIDVARAGAYSSSIARDIPPQSLERFFSSEDEGYRVNKQLREMIVFAPQNLIADPPFTKLDLLSCRNLLIYLDAKLQRRLLPIFHYALKPKGLLLLGSSESVGPYFELFTAVDKKAKIFRRSDLVSSAVVAEFPAASPELPVKGTSIRTTVAARSGGNIDQIVQRTLLKDLVPPTVLVHERGEVVHVHGRTGLYLEPAPGSQAGANIFNMARQGLQISLAAAIRQAATSEGEVILRGAQVRSNGGFIAVDLRARRLKEPESLRGLFRVTFEKAEDVASHGEATELGSLPDRIKDLERELEYAKEGHQGTVEELETANEELKSTNEELQSTNEELQSANEELETSKEEMQSLNEELQTVNAELQGKLDELSDANNDMKNLLNGTDIATVFIDGDLRIKRFTEQARKVIRIIATDVGRSIADLVSRLQYDRLIPDIREVLDTLVVKETEVRGEGGEWYLMRILPYRTTENVIDGLVLTFVDVTNIKTLQAEQDRLLDGLKDSLVSVFTQDQELRFSWVGNAVFGKDPRELIGKTDRDIFAPEEATLLRELKRRVLTSGERVRSRTALALGGDERLFDLYLEPRRSEAGTIVGISCVAIDVSQWGAS
jgi:two-component system CheB/CheR fusion protein